MDSRAFRYSPTKHQKPVATNKIEHQIDNEGCRCQLCQKLIFQEMQRIKNHVPKQIQQEKQEIGFSRKQREQFFVKYLTHFFTRDRLKTRLRLLVPQICVFEKGVPQFMFSKKKECCPIKLIRNKEKLNFYEVRNFFYEGYVYHNRSPDIRGANPPAKAPKSITFEVKDKETLKNECIAIARYTDNPGQLISLDMMENIFKASQRSFRATLNHIQTIVNARNYEEVRVRLNIPHDSAVRDSLFMRAKNEIRILNQQVKMNDLQYVSEKDEWDFEDSLQRQDANKYLKYIALKLCLLYSYSNSLAISRGTFKFTKGEGDYYYFVDLEVEEFIDKDTIWGETVTIGSSEVPNRPKTEIRGIIVAESGDGGNKQARKLLSQVSQHDLSNFMEVTRVDDQPVKKLEDVTQSISSNNNRILLMTFKKKNPLLELLKMETQHIASNQKKLLKDISTTGGGDDPQRETSERENQNNEGRNKRAGSLRQPFVNMTNAGDDIIEERKSFRINMVRGGLYKA